MDRLHARYPFLASARNAVEAADVDLAELVARGSAPAVDRACERVESALSEGDIGEPHRTARVELLSYPIARVLVSLLDEPMAIETYARAEAAAARERFEADLTEGGGTKLRSIRSNRIELDRLLAEFDLEGAVERTDDGLRMDVATFLRLSRNLDGQRWRLVDRALAAGRVPIERTELLALLEEAVAERVLDGLPLSVPQSIADGLDAEREAIEELLSDHDLTLAFDAVLPEAFPPCVTALLERARDGDALPAHSQFSLVAFLASTDLDADALCDLAGGGLDRETVEYQLAHLRDDRGGEYAPPSCATMDAYGDCVNRDERCDRISHPITYYERALDER